MREYGFWIGGILIIIKIAHDNLDAIIKAQPATDSQRELIWKLEHETGKIYHVEDLSKVTAGQILAETN